VRGTSHPIFRPHCEIRAPVLIESFASGYSTVISYLSVIKRVRAKWGTTRITRMKPMLIQAWLRELEAAPKTKGHIKAVMYRLYEKAML